MKHTRVAARQRRHHRVRKTLRGSQARPRLAVYRSNKYIYAQIIDDDAARTLVSASSRESSLSGERLTVETASKVGQLVAGRASEAGINEVVFDRGGNAFHGRIKALADAAREAGLKF
ncbi:MAG TPA: 50S ribosomal protein L18 [Actinobacteria bacterium]|nr:50S ribosomal protein L18 [bacterium BMS3Bbin02]HDL42237.1 50S ribosomal protein L18 [Actinomycetota bacterium]